MRDEFKHLKPGLVTILEKLKLDKSFTRGESNYLYYVDEKDEEVKVNDFVGGFGSLILGHNHPKLVKYAKEILDKNIPIHSQVSYKQYSSKLCEKISNLIEDKTGDKYICTLTNSGAETVEAAFKHARLKKNKEINRALERINVRINRINNSVLKQNIKNLNSEEVNDFAELKNFITSTNNKVLSKIKPIILACKKGYHGKTIGALKATYNPKYKAPFLFENEKEDVIFFDFDISQVCQLISGCSFKLLIPKLNIDNTVRIDYIYLNSCIGIIIEPILGEGGVIKTPVPFLNSLRNTASKQKIPLILDEIQTGIYRTGHFLYSLSLNIKADYYLIGKSLGGGMVKTGALLINEKQYDTEFCTLHTSTFAEDEYSSAISIKAIDLAQNNRNIIKTIGEYLFKRLEKLKERNNTVINSILGEGLMLGIKFNSYDDSNCYALQYISRSGYFNYFLSSYLLNNFNVRVAPTLSDSFIIRIQPSSLIEKEDIDLLIDSLESLIKVLFNYDIYYFTQHLLDKEYQNLRPLKKFNHGTVEIQESEHTKVGFLCHFIDYQNFIDGNPSFSVLPEDVVDDFLLEMVELNSCIVPGSKIITSNRGNQTEFIVIGLPFTSRMVKESFKNGTANVFRELCNKSIRYIKNNFDISVIGLGQYTSILLSNGKHIPQINMSITTGNSYTTYIGLTAVLNSFSDIRLEKKNIIIGIVGAAGNISSVYSKCFSVNASKIYLKGSDSKRGFESVKGAANGLLQFIFNRLLNTEIEKMSEIEEQLVQTHLFTDIKTEAIGLNDLSLYKRLTDELEDDSPIIVCNSKEFLKKCELVVLATNSHETLFTAEDFSCDTIIYDISIPPNIKESEIISKKGIKVISGGVVKIPNGESLDFTNFPFPLEHGSAFACMAETMILGLEKYKGNFSYGEIIPGMVYEIGEIGNRHGFNFINNKEIVIF